MSKDPILAVRTIATAVTLLAMSWALLLLASGLAMGFSDRSNVQIAMLLVFGLLLPAGATIACEEIAKNYVVRGQLASSIRWLLAGLLPIPLFYLIEMGLMLAGAPPL